MAMFTTEKNKNPQHTVRKKKKTQLRLKVKS